MKSIKRLKTILLTICVLLVLLCGVALTGCDQAETVKNNIQKAAGIHGGQDA